jgi:mono/diheme cytochrome c family protein
VVFYVWRFSTSAEPLAQGRQVYEQVCAACHGLEGSGELMGSADFTDLHEMDSLAPRDLYLTVTQGRGSMPSFQARLSQDERWAVIDYLRTFSYDPALPGETAAVIPTTATGTPASCSIDQTNPFAWDDASAIAAGQVIYAERCALCHGQDGAGGLPDTPDFTSPEVSVLLQANAGVSFCALTEGKGTMPAFGPSLTVEERWQVIVYLESLSP